MTTSNATGSGIGGSSGHTYTGTYVNSSYAMGTGTNISIGAGGQFTSGIYDTYLGPSYKCSSCNISFSATPSNLNAIFVSGFWFCSDDCRLQGVLNQLLRFESIEA